MSLITSNHAYDFVFLLLRHLVLHTYHAVRIFLGPTPAPSTPEPVQAGPLSLGCFKDDGDDHIMDDRALVDYSMTTEVILFRLGTPQRHRPPAPPRYTHTYLGPYSFFVCFSLFFVRVPNVCTPTSHTIFLEQRTLYICICLGPLLPCAAIKKGGPAPPHKPR